MMTERHAILRCPAVKSLRLTNVGPWRDLRLEFIRGINLITGPSGTGKGTILRALASDPSAYSSYGRERGMVDIEYCAPRWKYQVQPVTADEFREDRGRSLGERMYAQLMKQMSIMDEDAALLLHDGVLAVLDQPRYDTAVRMLNDIKCQIIIIVQHLRDSPAFRAPRTFHCRLENIQMGCRVEDEEGIAE
jgi:recombinational DNA repair ATPase RecF